MGLPCEDQKWMFIVSSIALHLRQDLSLRLELTDADNLAGQCTPDTLLFPPTGLGLQVFTTPTRFLHAGDLNLGLHVFVESTSLTEPWPQAHLNSS